MRSTLRSGLPGESDSESVYQPAFVRLGPKGIFLHWPDPPADLEKLHVEWADCPFTPEPFRCECRVLETTGEGLKVKLDGPTPATLKEWFERISALASQLEPDSALRTSKLYTGATVVSAGGLFCGALAILLPILSSGQWWIDVISKICFWSWSPPLRVSPGSVFWPGVKRFGRSARAQARPKLQLHRLP